jgi:hypothetical protein
MQLTNNLQERLKLDQEQLISAGHKISSIIEIEQLTHLKVNPQGNPEFTLSFLCASGFPSEPPVVLAERLSSPADSTILSRHSVKFQSRILNEWNENSSLASIVDEFVKQNSSKLGEWLPQTKKILMNFLFAA